VGVCFYLLRALVADTQPFFLNLGNQITFPCPIQIHSTTTSLYLSLIFIFYSFIFHIHRQHCGAPSCLSRIILPFNHFALFLFFFFCFSLSLSLPLQIERDKKKGKSCCGVCLAQKNLLPGPCPAAPPAQTCKFRLQKWKKMGPNDQIDRLAPGED
jgi:hypothetical protein